MARDGDKRRKKEKEGGGGGGSNPYTLPLPKAKLFIAKPAPPAVQGDAESLALGARAKGAASIYTAVAPPAVAYVPVLPSVVRAPIPLDDPPRRDKIPPLGAGGRAWGPAPAPGQDFKARFGGANRGGRNGDDPDGMGAGGMRPGHSKSAPGAGPGGSGQEDDDDYGGGADASPRSRGGAGAQGARSSGQVMLGAQGQRGPGAGRAHSSALDSPGSGGGSSVLPSIGGARGGAAMPNGGASPIGGGPRGGAAMPNGGGTPNGVGTPNGGGARGGAAGPKGGLQTRMGGAANGGGGSNANNGGASAGKPAALPLGGRAVHAYFLMELSKVEVEVPDKDNPGSSRMQRLDTLTTAQVVQHFIRPLARKANCCFANAVAGGAVQLPGEILNSEGRFIEDSHTIGQAGESAFGPATFYISHAWSYRWKDLVSLIEQHYNSLPAETGWLQVYYWLDIFAVGQHLDPDKPFTENPDSDFASVIRGVKSVLFTIHPLLRPVTPSRLWCLYEALVAHRSQGVLLEMLVDDAAGTNMGSGSYKEAYLELMDRFKNQVLQPMDVATASTSVEADRLQLMSLIDQDLGADKFNELLRELLQHRMLDALLRHSLRSGDAPAAKALLGLGASFHTATFSMAGAKAGGDAVSVILAQVLSQSHSLQRLWIRRTNLKASGVEALAAALRTNSVLQELDLMDNAEIGDRGVMAITAAISGTLAPEPPPGQTDVAEEVLGRNYVPPSQPQQSLRELVLCNCGVRDEGAAAVGAALATRGVLLQKIDLGSNKGITSIGLGALAKGLSSNASLTKLVLSKLPAVGDAAAALGDAIGRNATLATLVLTGCRLRDEHLAALMPGLTVSASLSHLDLEDNALGGRSGGLLGDLLSANSQRLAHLRIDNNDGAGAGLPALAAALPNATGLRILGLHGVGLSAVGAKALVSALPKAPWLQELDLGGNPTADDSVMASIISCLKGHRGLAKLNLSSNELGASSAAALMGLIKPPSHPPALQNIVLASCEEGLGDNVVAAVGRWCKQRRLQAQGGGGGERAQGDRSNGRRR